MALIIAIVTLAAVAALLAVLARLEESLLADPEIRAAARPAPLTARAAAVRVGATVTARATSEAAGAAGAAEVADAAEAVEPDGTPSLLPAVPVAAPEPVPSRPVPQYAPNLQPLMVPAGAVPAEGISAA